MQQQESKSDEDGTSRGGLLTEVKQQVTKSERPLGELLAQVSRDGSTLIQKEIALAKVEIHQAGEKLKQGMMSAATGALVLYAGLLTLIAAVVLLLALAMPTWVAALLVGVVVTSIGVVLVGRGKKNLNQVELLPENAIKSIERDVDMVKEAVR